MPPPSHPQLDETETLMIFIAEVPIHFSRVRVFRRNIVNAQASVGGRHFHAKAGVKGQADAYALVHGGGHIEIETKAAKGTMREAQLAWQAQMDRMQIPYLVLRIGRNEATDVTIARWIEELRDAVDLLTKHWVMM